MNWVESRERYTGDWKQDLQCGYGEHVWIEERCDSRNGAKETARPVIRCCSLVGYAI